MRQCAALAALAVLLPAAASAQESRAELLERMRAEKARVLKPYEPTKLEKFVNDADEGRFRRMIQPQNGFFVQYGYEHKPVGSGIGFGGGFRHDLFDRQARVILEAGGTFRGYRMLRADFSLPRLAGGRVEVGAEIIDRHHPQEDFYGLSNTSLRDDRVSFLYDSRELQSRAVVRLTPWMRAGTRVGRLAPTLGRGTDKRYPSIEDRFDEASAPGLTEQPDYAYGDVFAEIDSRDEPGHARSGGFYAVTWRKYADRDFDRYGFNAFDVQLQQFFPIFDKKRVFAFQFAAIGTHADDGGVVPFYMQPTIGGGRTVRSLQDYRLRDTHAMWLNVEYRWEAFGLLDMALFTDWGKVAPRASDLDFSNLKRAYGIGFRFTTGKAVFFRFDVATGGGEGIRYIFKYSKVF